MTASPPFPAALLTWVQILLKLDQTLGDVTEAPIAGALAHARCGAKSCREELYPKSRAAASIRIALQARSPT